MTSVNISLPDVLKDYIDEQVSVGGYGTVSEYIRDLIRQDRQSKSQEKLETLLLEGLDSGDSTPMTSEDWNAVRDAVRSRISHRASERDDIQYKES